MSTTIDYQRENELLRKQLAEANETISNFLTKDKLFQETFYTQSIEKDIDTQCKLTEEALQRSETRLRTLYESTNDAVMLLNEDGFF